MLSHLRLLYCGESRRASLGIVASAVAWGLWWMPVRWLAHAGLHGDLVSVCVYLPGAAMLAPFVLRRWRDMARHRGALIGIGVTMGAALAMTNTALLHGEVVRVLLLFYLAPVWATLLNTIVLREPLTVGRVLAVVAGLLGAALVLGGPRTLPLPVSLGDWMGLLAGISFALGSLAIRRTGAARGAASEPAVQMFCGFLFAGLVGVGFRYLIADTGPVSAASEWAVLPVACGLALIWLIPQMWLYAWGAARLDPGRVSILMLVEPMVAVISAGLLLSEPLSGHEILGCVFILSAAVLDLAKPLQRPLGNAVVGTIT